jgi:PAS domain S-box-containing protein
VNLFHVIGYPLFLIAALEITLGIILLRNNPRKSRVQNAVTALSFFSAAFSFTSAIMYMRASLGLSIDLVARVNWIGWFTVPSALQILLYLKDERGRAGHIVGLVLYPAWLVILGLCLFTDLIVAPGYSVIPFINHPGPFENAARLFGSLLALWLLFGIIRLKKELRGIKKAQLNYFFQGVLIFGGGAAFTAGFLQIFGGFGFEPGLASFFSLPWVVLTYYAITRHRLFDIRLIFSRVLSVVLLLLLFSFTQTGLFKLLTPALDESLSILISLSVIGIFFFGTRLNRRMQGWVQQLVLQDKYDYQGVLKESIKAIITILELDELLGYIIASMKKSLGVESVYLLLKEKGGQFSVQHGQNVLQETVPASPPIDALVAWLLRTGHGVVREELENMPSDGASQVSEALKKMGAELIIPLLYKGDIKGFLVLGQKGNQESYLQSDIDLLETLAGHAAVAIENAQLYEESRQAKESMRESEAKFRTLAETAATAIFIHQGGNFLYANRAAEIIGGYPVDEYLKMNFLSLAHPDHIDMIQKRARERLVGGQPPPQYEFKIVKKNGEERWVLMTAGITEFEGKSTVIGTLIDITARKQAEEERERYYQQLQKATQSLQESEEKFRTLAETTTAAIFIHQGQKLVYANTAGETMTGYTREELLQEDFWTLIHPDYQELAKERGKARLRGEQVPQEYEFKFVRKNGGERWAATTAGVIEYGGQPAIIATLFDITDWKRAEEAKIKFYEESVRQYQERIEEEKRHRLEKEKILMDLHDGIGGITTNISILSELAQKATDGETVKRTLSTISRLSREGISEIRSFMHSLDSKELNWRTLAAELRNQGTNMAEPHNIKFTIETAVEDTYEQPGSLIWVNIFKIYKEALTNVIKHSKATTVKVEFRVNRYGVRLVVEDDGIGLQNGRIGGRGLSHMKTRAEEIGGTASIVADHGTRVSFELPLPLKYPAEGMVKP